jgi:hypothetical protein
VARTAPSRESTPPRARAALAPDVVRLLVLAAIAFGAFVLVYLLAVQTELGQRSDDAALTGTGVVPERAQGAADKLLRVVSVGSLLAATAVLSVLAWLRRRPGLLLIPAAVIGISLLATELFKYVIFTRPDLGLDPYLIDNTYPSGHTTVAVSIGLAGVLVAPSHLRPTVALAAFALAAAAGVFVVTADWHRPSDPIGSYLLTLAVAATCMAYLRGRAPAAVTGVHRRAGSLGSGSALRLELVALLSGAGLFVGSLVIASLRYGAEVDWNRFHAAFLLAAAVIVVFAGLVVAALLRGLGSVDRGPPPRPRVDLG